MVNDTDSGQKDTPVIMGKSGNNPLNIRYSASNNWKGQIGKSAKGFAIFDTMVNGLRASFINLRTYHKRGITTIRKIVYTWAPVADNNPNNENYIAYIVSKSGLNADKELVFDFETYSKVVKYMAYFESNYTPTDNELLQAWEQI